jgi:hypothetical protein
VFARLLRLMDRRSTEAAAKVSTDSGTSEDSVLLQAIEVARSVAIEEAGEGAVGDHVEALMEGDGLVSHSFECLSPAYVGWRWSVTLARVPGAGEVTVNEVLLLPGPDSILAPSWVPWSDRVRPGDLSVGDVLPTAPDDPRLVPSMLGLDDLEGLAGQSPLHPGQWEVGLGRARVLSPNGHDAAVERWQRGETGPQSAMARHAALTCSTCGFLVPIGGTLGQAFGLCANAFGAADGRVVAFDYGCGAHSEIVADESPVPSEVPQPLAADQGDGVQGDGVQGDGTAETEDLVQA